MTSFGHHARYAGHRVSVKRGGTPAGRIGSAIAALLILLLVGERAATAFDSPLLAIVTAGMLFLIGVAVQGAINYGRR